VAAIEALIALLNTTPSSTVHETTVVLKKNVQRLKESVHNPLALSAGADLFIRYLVSSLKQQEGDPRTRLESFEARRERLLRSGRDFAARAIQARETIASFGATLCADGRTIVTHGASRAVAAILARAAAPPSRRDHRHADAVVRFRVIYVSDELRPRENEHFVAELRARGIPVACITMAAAGHALSIQPRPDAVLVGAEVVTQDNGIISRIGTNVLATLAKQNNVPFYVAAETHKFVRKFVTDNDGMAYGEMGIKQTVVEFQTGGTSTSKTQSEDAVDHTVWPNPRPPHAGVKLGVAWRADLRT
jgi:translation initiation factor eIF-2B subunit alpha